ncbi:hypothetical protein A3D77_04040 [Candidatus Gottesmanbacteria bacterium RIFCSPHIGHO2_02_FULL_39_11]|uniref:LamG-like jellyroll fold domain-containing protein n=1 Tax=Candidatus Gottesmanbacteria bacterium RIFCSPHIGHO2_02_FULL_39_11 TaxID=1798382 RepID=A0A1F5ZJJ5_9BACT|nr:MAG: hypothetical protein A3D77_04040 [Candidatus Gottesmanbacteria bacterium RIFCSPHIGHO2_02_FULL_39_11]
MKKTLRVVVLLVLVSIISIFASGRVNAAPSGNYIDLNGGYLKASGYYPGSFSTVIFDAWINPSDVSGTRPIFSIGDKSTGLMHYFLGINGGSLVFQFKFSSSSSKYLSAGQILPNTWTHVLGKITPSQTTLYINDANVISSTGASNLLSLGNSIIVGAAYDESFFSQKFLGSLDEVKISSDTQPLLYWHLDEQRGENIAKDSSGNGLYGVLVGGDNSIHFHGVLPTPTPFLGGIPFPTSRIVRPSWTLPTIGFPNPTGIGVPTQGSSPTTVPIPTLPGMIRGPRPTRTF